MRLIWLRVRDDSPTWFVEDVPKDVRRWPHSCRFRATIEPIRFTMPPADQAAYGPRKGSNPPSSAHVTGQAP